MSKSLPITGDVKELLGYPVEEAVKLLPSTVTQFAAKLDTTNSFWIISYIEPVTVSPTIVA